MTRGADAVHVRVVRSLSELSVNDWDALLTDEDSPFVRYHWLQSLEEAGCVSEQTGWQPQHITIWRKEKLIAAAPAYLKFHSEGEFVFDHAWASAAESRGISYYPKLLVSVPFTPTTGGRLLVHPEERRDLLAPILAGAIRAACEKLDLSSAHVLFPLERDMNVLHEAGFAERYGIQNHWHNHSFTSYDDYLMTFNSKRRHQLKREKREVEKAGIVTTTYRGEFLTPAILDHMFEFYLATVEKFRPWTRQYLNRDFFEMVNKRMPNSVEVVLASENGKNIGGALNILGTNGTLYGRYWGAIEERPFLHFHVCYYHSIEDCINRGIQVFEPGAGGAHKIPRGFRPTVTRSAHHIRSPRFRLAVERFLAAEREAVLRAVKETEE